MNYKYLYTINYPEYEKELCMMEIKSLFNIETKKKYFLSNICINPSRSLFLKEKIEIKYKEKNFKDILDKIKSEKLAYDNYKVLFVRLEDCDIEYKKRLTNIKEIGMIIQGKAEFNNPDNRLALSRIDGEWIFGEYEKDDLQWHIHDSKPYNYSNSLSVRVARALVNIAIENNLDQSLIDPCCGVGTIVIEALSMGINVLGYEINKSIAANARRNLEFFGYEKDYIISGDMHNITKSYDVAILDIPYGLFSSTTLEIQTNIMKTARRISNKAVIITFEDMSNLINEIGFKINYVGRVSKGKFIRYIYKCE